MLRNININPHDGQSLIVVLRMEGGSAIRMTTKGEDMGLLLPGIIHFSPNKKQCYFWLHSITLKDSHSFNRPRQVASCILLKTTGTLKCTQHPAVDGIARKVLSWYECFGWEQQEQGRIPAVFPVALFYYKTKLTWDFTSITSRRKNSPMKPGPLPE